MYDVRGDTLMTGNGGMENGSAWLRTRFGSLDVLADVPHELSAQIGDGGEDATGDDRESPGSNGSPKYWVSRATFPSLNSTMLTV